MHHEVWLTHPLTHLQSVAESNFGPYHPRFLAKEAYVESVNYMGKERDHSRIGIKLEGGIEKHDLIAFKQRYKMATDRRINCSYTISKNEWNGKISIQMMLDRLY